MRITSLLVTIGLFCGMNTLVLADRNVIPDDYPSHAQTTGCIEPGDITALQEKLQEYNVTRVQVADVLHAMADSYKLDDEIRSTLLGFADSFEQLGRNIPQPNPDTDEFRNFDFKLGLSLTAVTIFLNSRDETLTRQFNADRDNPDSVIGLYLAELDRSREAYMTGLAGITSEGKTGICS